MDPTKFKSLQNPLADFVDFGNKQNAAKFNLQLMQDNKDEAKEVVLRWVKKYGDKAKTATTKKNLGEFKADLPNSLKEKGEDFVRLVDERGLAQGSRDLIGRYDDELKLAELNRIATTPESVLEKYAPYLSSYTVNRLGTNAIGDLIRSHLGRATRFWNSEEESEE